ncbi:MAG: hypothetical protein WBW48_13795 [Anaerolineae bacterium]
MGDDKVQTETDLRLKLATELDKESDRALVILAASYLDHLLRRLITAALKLEGIPRAADRFLFEGLNAGLASFYSRYEMARHLGLFNEAEIKDLSRIRKIRNEFAHDFIGVSFETGRVVDLCNALEIAKIDGVPPTARECYKRATIRFMVEILRRIQVMSEDRQ